MIAVRATEDVITDAGLWADNARVAVYAPLAKAYAGCPVPGLDVVPPVAGAVAALAEFRPEAGELVGELLVAEAEHMAGRARRGVSGLRGMPARQRARGMPSQPLRQPGGMPRRGTRVRTQPAQPLVGNDRVAVPPWPIETGVPSG